MPDLAGKVAVITGAARGTGRVHCERLADAGADVIAVDTGDPSELAGTADAVTSRGRRSRCRPRSVAPSPCTRAVSTRSPE